MHRMRIKGKKGSSGKEDGKEEIRTRVEPIIHVLRKNIELDFFLSRPSDPFYTLISTVLSQRTKDENTKNAADLLFSYFDTPKKLAEAPIDEVEQLIRQSGFYRVKARRVRNISHDILDRFGGKVPDNMEDLLSLEGVGRKTANCVLVYGFRVPAMPVDTHVHRISNRLGLIRTRTPEESEQELVRIIPRKYWLDYNELLVKFGQRICRPVRPMCWQCPIVNYCVYTEKTPAPRRIP